jgi:hypothetical protein
MEAEGYGMRGTAADAGMRVSSVAADASIPRFAINLAALLAPHDMVWPGPLPSDWRHGAPLGNGEFGATVYGGPHDLSIALSRPDVWDRRNDAQSWMPATSFPDIRAAWQTRDKAGLDRLWREAATRKPVDMPHLTTCGTLRLRLDEGLNPAGLSLRVRLLDGTACLTWNDRRVTACISRQYGVLMLEIDRGLGVPEPDGMRDCYDRQLPLAELPWELSRPPLDENPRAIASTDAGIGLLVQHFTAGGDYAIGIAFAGFGASERAILPGRLAGLETAPAARVCRVFVTVVSSQESEDPERECRCRLRAALAEAPETIVDTHTRWWHDYWMRGLAAVGDQAVERWYYRSLYLCGSALEPGRQLPGLQGMWSGENYPVWFADYHANVNVQSNVWGMFANNRLECVEPYLRLYEGFAGEARSVARQFFGMRGLKFPHAGSIGGHELTAPAHSRLSVDPCESAWIARLFWDCWRYGGDRGFLRDVAYPILRDVALFLADYLVWDDRRGCWLMGPMVHFESRAGEWEGWDDNTLYGQAFVRMGLTQALEAAGELGIDPDLQALWQERLDHLTPVPAASDGTWVPWENRPPSGDGHSFMLPLVFPAELVSAAHGPERWRQQALDTWRKLRDCGAGTLSGKAWCGGQGIAEVLRLGDVDTAFAATRWPTGACPNGLGTGEWGGHAFMQADHAMGMCRVLADFMLLELGGVLYIFHGIPADVPARFFSLRAPGGFLVSAEKRGKTTDYVVVQATRSGRLRLANPGPEADTLDVVSGRLLTREKDRIVELVLSERQRLVLTPSGHGIEALPVTGFQIASKDSETLRPS